MIRCDNELIIKNICDAYSRLKHKHTVDPNTNNNGALPPASIETLAAALEMRQLAEAAYKLPYDLATERGLYNAYHNRAESVYDNIDEMQTALHGERFGSVPPPYDSTSEWESRVNNHVVCVNEVQLFKCHVIHFCCRTKLALVARRHSRDRK